MPREFCLRCRRPRSACLCPAEPPMRTRTRVVLLMHPKEARKTKSNTGRLTCINLENSEIIQGIGFDDDRRVRKLVDDPGNLPVLLYPGAGAADISDGPLPFAVPEGRTLVVFLIDATWACSHSVLRASPGLARLPRIMFTPREKSRWVIKRQPADYCLATIEAAHELLLALEAAGVDEYPDKSRLLDAFAAMQAYQIERAAT
ncbi:MAG: DTW domain-containing protein [Treponema sp.]|nr:DTW domain-containing protein [Treponema sp.]